MAQKNFEVKLMTPRRQVVRLTLSARNAVEARREAAKRGQVLSIKKQRSSSFGGLGLADRLVFFQRLAAMLSARVGTTEALDVIVSSFSGSIRDAARTVRDLIVNENMQLYEAMEAAGPKYFPPAIVAIIKTGAAGGDMAYAIREAARFERELAQVKKDSSKGVFSALGGFVIGIITILASTLYVAPQILESSFIEATGGADIGWIMTIADIVTYIAVFAALVVGLMVMSGVVLRPIAPAVMDRVILRIPFYRDMVLAKSNYIVLFGLAVLLKAGLRVEDALKLTISGAPKGELKNDLNRALKAITSSQSRPWPYAMTMLHPTDKAALATAQDREQTARTIEELAVQYQALYKSRMETFVPAMQAFSAIFLSFAGFVLFGVSIVPLMQSSSNVMKML